MQAQGELANLMHILSIIVRTKHDIPTNILTVSIYRIPGDWIVVEASPAPPAQHPGRWRQRV